VQPPHKNPPAPDGLSGAALERGGEPSEPDMTAGNVTQVLLDSPAEGKPYREWGVLEDGS